jgi:hypothetical protein
MVTRSGRERAEDEGRAMASPVKQPWTGSRHAVYCTQYLRHIPPVHRLHCVVVSGGGGLLCQAEEVLPCLSFPSCDCLNKIHRLFVSTVMVFRHVMRSKPTIVFGYEQILFCLWFCMGVKLGL